MFAILSILIYCADNCKIETSVAISKSKGSVKNILGVILFVATFIASSFLNISVVYIIIAAALIGIISDYVERKRGSEE